MKCYMFLIKENQSKKKQRVKLLNYSCIQLFSNDAILNYLLRKKSCTKYYFVWSAASKTNQNQFIKELSDTNIINGLQSILLSTYHKPIPD